MNTLKATTVPRALPHSPLQSMDHANSNPSQPPYYYPHNIPVHTAEIPVELYAQAPAPENYIPNASSHLNNQAFSHHLYHHQQEQEYSYQRYQRQQLQLQQQQQHPRHHQPSPPAQQAFHAQVHSPLQQHDQLGHAQPQQSLASASPPLQHSPRVSPPRPTHSPPSEASTSYLSNHSSDPLSALRNDLQVHAAATALTQAASITGDNYASSGVPRLPPILQVEKQQVTTTATQAASASRRRNEATFRCPVPGCGSTFTRRFNLKGHLRSHTSERPYVCEWPGCGKGFARQHDCKRHYQLHSAKAGAHMCQGCGKSFSRTDALNRHLRSDGGLECRLQQSQGAGGSTSTLSLASGSPRDSESLSDSTSATDGTPSSRSRPPSM